MQTDKHSHTHRVPYTYGFLTRICEQPTANRKGLTHSVVRWPITHYCPFCMVQKTALYSVWYMDLILAAKITRMHIHNALSHASHKPTL